MAHEADSHRPAPEDASGAVANGSWRIGLLIVVLAVLSFPPVLNPYEAYGLDPSWKIGLDEAAQRRLVFGRDVGFTYGPLGRVFYPLCRGDALPASLPVTGVLHAALLCAVAVAARLISGAGKLGAFAVGMITSGVVGLGGGIYGQAGGVCGTLVASCGFLVAAHLTRRTIWAIPGLALAAAALLTKFNIGVAAVGSSLAYLALGLARVGPARAIRQAILLLGFLGGAFFGLFVITNGPVQIVGRFLQTSWWMSSGYSSQMALYHPNESILLMLVVVLVGCAIYPLLDRRSWGDYTAVLFILAFPLFIAFKSAFVRCDTQHVLSGFALLLALMCLLLPAEVGPSGTRALTQAILASSMALFLGLALEEMTPHLVLWEGPRHIRQLQRWGRVRKDLAKKYEEFRTKDALPQPIRAPIGSMPVDVYPWDISLVAANDLNWSPRFVLQSYQALHPALDALGAAHYAGRDARTPRFVLYRYEGVDAQHPCLVDSRTWLELYRWYDLAEQDSRSETLLLERRTGPRFGEPRIVETRTMAWNERVAIPGEGRGLIMLEAELNLTPLGRVKDYFYKTRPPMIDVEYADGTTGSYRFVWKNLGGGALVSSLPRSCDSVAESLRGIDSDRVRAITFVASPRWFRSPFQARFSRLDVVPEH